MAEVGSAFVSIMPSAQGFGAATSAAIGPQMASAGKSAGLGFAKTAALGIAAGLAGAAAITKGLYEIGQTFDDLSDTIVVTTGASGKALKGLEDTAIRIGKTTPSSFADIGTAVAELNTRLGITGKPLEDLSTKVLNLSRITGTDLSGNIADLTRVFGDWGIKTKDQSKALDEIFFTSQETGTGIDSLAQSVVQMGAPLRQFGFSFEESLAMFGKWEKEGVNTTAVMSGLKIGLGKFSAAGKDPQKALDAVTKAIGAAGSAGEANAIAIEAFGQRAGPDMAAAVREGRFELDDLVSSIEGSKGTIEDADSRTRDFAESWQVIKNNVLVGLQPIAEKVFSAFADGAAKVVPLITQFVRQMQNGKGTGGQFAEVLGNIGGVIQSVAGWVRSDLFPAMQSYWDWMKTNILPGLQDFIDKLGKGLQGAFENISQAIQDNRPQIEAFIEGAKRLGKWIGDVVLPAMGDWANIYFPALGKAIGLGIKALSILTDMTLALVVVGSRAFRMFLQAVMLTFGGIIRGAAEAFGWMPGIGPKVKAANAAFQSLGNQAIDNLRSIENEARAMGAALDAATRNRTITITTVHNTIGGVTSSAGGHSSDELAPKVAPKTVGGTAPKIALDDDTINKLGKAIGSDRGRLLLAARRT